MNDSRRDLDQPGKVTVKRSGPDRGNACDVAGIGRALLTHVYLVFFGRLVPYSEGHRAESQEGSSCNLVSHGFRCRSVVVSDTHHKPPACDLLEDAGIARFFPKNLTSVEHGRREPCPSAYQHALSITGGRANTGLFVRDSYEHDYAGLRAVGLHDPLIDRAGTRLIPDEHRLKDILDLRERIEL